MARDRRRRPPIIDPTANVLKLVEEAMRRQDDLRLADTRRLDELRIQTERYQERLEGERVRADLAASKAEAGRIDALLLANTNNVALALEKQGAQATAQDRRIAVLEQNQYQAGGKDIQRTEQRTQSNWSIGQIVSIGGVVVLVLLDLKTKGVI